jgi:Mrp family chromosome partitioning ATPase
MSRNFELMQQTGQNSAAASIPRPKAVFSQADERAIKNGVRPDLGQVVHEGTRMLVQRIFLQQTPKAARSVLFAGIGQGNGCDQICLQVADALRSSIRGSVCLVEANLRSPSLTGLLGTTNHYGLTDALRKEGPIRSFAKPLLTDNFWLLSCGAITSDSPDLLNSDRISERFDELRKEFDYVLVDAPPVTRYSDAAALGRLTDGLVLVLEGNSTRKEAALKVIESLRTARIEVLGAVLN